MCKGLEHLIVQEVRVEPKYMNISAYTDAGISKGHGN